MTIPRLKVLIAPDKFRPKLSSKRVCQIISSELAKKFITKSIPLADGGEGSLEAIAETIKAQEIHLTVNDPLFRPINGYYLLQKQNNTAYIEMSKVSGLSLLNASERNPMKTSTFGTGQLIKNAVESGCKKIVLMIGGSATNEGGIGAACALGYRIADINNCSLKPIGENLRKIQKIVSPKINLFGRVKVLVATDVTSPLVGEKGATFLFGTQKGANKQQLQILQEGLIKLNKQFIKHFNKDLQKTPGGGAAGGLGAGCIAFFNASIVNGFQLITEIVNLKESIKQADIIITGEGKLDNQTLGGKLVQGVVSLAKQFGKPVVIFCGKSEIDKQQLGENVTIIQNQKPNMTKQESIERAQELLTNNLRQYFKL